MTHGRKHLGSLPPCHHRPGVVIVITMFAVLLFLAMILYVLNIGRQTAARIETQNAADAAAISAAGSLARSYNTVSQNNVTITRLIADTMVLDAMPQAVNNSLKEQLAIQQAINDELPSISNNLWFVKDRLIDMITPVDAAPTQTATPPSDSILDEIEWLEQMNDFFANNDVTSLTTYPNGQFWQAMNTLTDQNRGVMQNADALAVLAGEQAARTNLTGDSHEVLITRFNSNIPYVEGTFDDFKDPVTRGLLPQQIDGRSGPTLPGYPQYRGPWDTLFGRRDSYMVPPSIGSHIQGFPGRPETPPTSTIPVLQSPRYQTIGPLVDLLDNVHGINRYDMPYSHFLYDVANLTFSKLQYIWPDAHQYARGIHIADPVYHADWTTGYNPINTGNIKQSLLLVIEICSQNPPGDLESPSLNPPAPPDSQPDWWDYVDDRPDGRYNIYPKPFAYRRNQFVDPALNDIIPGGTWIQLSGDIWRRSEYISNPNPDPETGLSEPYYWITYFFFVGYNRGQQIQPRNPFDGLDVNSSSAPHPTYFDPASRLVPPPVDVDVEPVNTQQSQDPNPYLANRLSNLTFFAAVGQSDRTVGNQFTRRMGDDNIMAAVAQAYVFNNHSYDLWTQMWRSQLEPVGRLQPAVGYENWITASQDGTLKTHLYKVQPLAETLRH